MGFGMPFGYIFFLEACKHFHGLIVKVYLQRPHNNTTNTMHHQELQTKPPHPHLNPSSDIPWRLAVLNEMDVGLQHLKKESLCRLRDDETQPLLDKNHSFPLQHSPLPLCNFQYPLPFFSVSLQTITCAENCQLDSIQ
jgi:hypothetical protein